MGAGTAPPRSSSGILPAQAGASQLSYVQVASERAAATSAADLHSIVVGAAGGTLASAATLASTLRKAKRSKRGVGRKATETATLDQPSVDEAVKSRTLGAQKNVAGFNFADLSGYGLEELEEVYIDAVWCYHAESTKLIEDSQFDVLKEELKKRKAPLLNLKPNEVAFVEASIAYYRGAPLVTDEEYERLKKKVRWSFRRKDMTAFILYERSAQYLKNEALAKMREAFVHATSIDFAKLNEYELGELEELFIDALWCYYREKRGILTDQQYDQLKQVLYAKGSKFPTLKQEEVAFCEAFISYYRGDPLVSDEEYDKLKTAWEVSGKRKDVTAFLLYQRGEQFLDEGNFAEMQGELKKLGMSPVDLNACNLAQMEEMYVDALWAYYNDGTQLLSDEQYNKLKEELAWQGSGFPKLTKVEVDFVKASLSYYRGEPIASDEEWERLKKEVLKVEGNNKRADVAAFLLYSKGAEVLDPDTFEKLKSDMSKLGVRVQKAGSKALEQTLSISSDRLYNDWGEVITMIFALGTIPTILCVASVWAIGLALDIAFVPEPEWAAVFTAEFVPLFGIGLVLGGALTWQLLSFLDLQFPELLTGTCPSCESTVKCFRGGAEPPAQVEHSCTECGCKMVFDTYSRRIVSAGLGAKVSGQEQEIFDWTEEWEGLRAKQRAAM
jgi:transcriptional regulator of met regulon